MPNYSMVLKENADWGKLGGGWLHASQRLVPGPCYQRYYGIRGGSRRGGTNSEKQSGNGVLLPKKESERENGLKPNEKKSVKIT